MSLIDDAGESRTVPKTCVVVSYWAGRSANPLHRLLDQMRTVDAGSPFDLTIVANGGDKAPLTLPARFDGLRPRILNRENVGYNIAAWDHGWRTSEPRDNYLFLQDDCKIKEPGWVSEFEYRIEVDTGLGLLGEMVFFDRMSWDFVRAVHYVSFLLPPSTWSEPLHPIDIYRACFDRQGIPWSEVASHLPSIILFSPRRVLEEIGGFPFFGPTYREALASELAITRLVESRGYRFSKVRDSNFALIGHPQWLASGNVRESGPRAFLINTVAKARATIKQALGLKRKHRRPRPMPVVNVPGGHQET